MVQTKRVLNKTKNVALAERAEVANTSFQRLKGLLGRQGLEAGQGMIITPCSSIHTFFMRFAIDAIFLGRDGQVVAMAHSLPPARLFGSPLKGKLVIELPPGVLKETMTELNDAISIE
ncbi:DUF192 domain-containing protein [Candidatus Omnitrophota bacterium]